MTIHYTVRTRPNLRDFGARPKFYGAVKTNGVLSHEKLAENIAQASTTVGDTDVLAVLNELAKQTESALADGKIVRFGRLGSFYISLSSEGVDTEEQFSAHQIKQVRVNFTPGNKLKAALRNAAFKKI
jgi:predicted histone-like DNA-binding protein